MNKEALVEFQRRKAEFMEFAISTAKAAGKIHMELYNSNHDIEWTGRVHFRAEADTKVSEMLREQLAKTYPDHNIHSEESEDYKTGSPFKWVDDELDGTIGYTRRFFDGFAFSRALCIDSTPVLGVVYMSLKNYLYTGILGEPSQLNNKPIRVSPTDKLNKSIMVFGGGKEIPGKEGFKLSHFPFLLKAMEQPSIMTDVGFACGTASLCFVADGRLEASLFTSAEDEDIAASAVILEGAGATVTNLALEPWRLGNKSVLAANPVIHDQLATKFKDVISNHIDKWGII
jgi:fructose-1,6-bisphosphatase/inositol monophosphatase family enzyme